MKELEQKIFLLEMQIKELKIKLYKQKKELKDANQRYDALKVRYLNQNDELITMKAFLSEEGYNENKHRNSKKRTSRNK